jgi:two-component system, sensor histidine kinase PdtaS
MKLFVLLLVLIPALVLSQPQKIDSLQKVIAGKTNSGVMPETLNELGIAYMTIGMIDSAKLCFAQSLESNKTQKDMYEWVRSLSETGNILSVKGMYKPALDTLLLAKDNIVKLNSGARAKIEMRLYKYLGDLYGRAGLYEKSAAYLQKSIQLANENNDRGLLAKNYNTLAINYAKLSNFPLAIEYNKKCLAIFNETGDKIRIGNTYSNLAALYKEKGDNDSAIKFNKMAESLYNETEYKFGLPNTLSINAEIMRDNKNFTAALAEYRKLLQLDKELDLQNSLGFDYQAIAFLFRDLSNLDSSNYYFKSSIEKFSEAEMRKELATSYGELTQNYLLLNKADSAKKYYNLFTSANAAFLDEEKVKAITDAEIKFETSLKEATIKTQQAEITVQKQQNRWLITGAAAAALVALILAMLYRRIKKQKSQIESQKREIIHNNRNNIQQLISIFSRQAENSNLKESAVANQERLYTLNLLNKLLYENGESNNANVKDYLLQLGEAKKISTGREVNIQISTPSIVLKSNLLKDIGLIINELTTNCIKHAFSNTAEPLIKIDLQQQDNYINITLADNGSGLPQDFSINDSRNSFGLDFVKDLAAQHHGKIKAYNNAGAVFEIMLRQ